MLIVQGIIGKDSPGSKIQKYYFLFQLLNLQKFKLNLVKHFKYSFHGTVSVISSDPTTKKKISYEQKSEMKINNFEKRNHGYLIILHSCMPSPLAPHPIRVQSYVLFLF